MGGSVELSEGYKELDKEWWKMLWLGGGGGCGERGGSKNRDRK